jgi:hypothetical protein
MRSRSLLLFASDGDQLFRGCSHGHHLFLRDTKSLAILSMLPGMNQEIVQVPDVEKINC